jgi:hypothetical protein
MGKACSSHGKIRNEGSAGFEETESQEQPERCRFILQGAATDDNILMN